MTRITDQQAADWVRRGAHIRVNAGTIGCEDVVMAAGKVVSWCAAPSLTIEHADGTRSSWPADLPMVEQDAYEAGKAKTGTTPYAPGGESRG